LSFIDRRLSERWKFLLALPLSDKKFIGTFYRECENYSGNFFMRNALRTKLLGVISEYGNTADRRNTLSWKDAQ
jgi:hypothetical protein